MVLSTAGNCSLCGSAVQGDGPLESPSTATPEVGIPFGLGESTQSEELKHLPFGIEDAPEASPQSIQAAGDSSPRPDLPFGIDDAPDASGASSLETEAEEETPFEPNSRQLLFGLEDAPSENTHNSEEKAPAESRNPSLELPYGIDHMHHTPID